MENEPLVYFSVDNSNNCPCKHQLLNGELLPTLNLKLIFFTVQELI